MHRMYHRHTVDAGVFAGLRGDNFEHNLEIGQVSLDSERLFLDWH